MRTVRSLVPQTNQFGTGKLHEPAINNFGDPTSHAKR